MVLCAAAFIAVTSACDGGTVASTTAPAPTTTTSTSTTTTTVDPSRTCGDVAADAAALLIDIVAELDEVAYSQLTDRASWPPELVDLETRGADLDIQIATLGCDPGTIQLAAVEVLPGMDPEGPMARLLIRILLGD